MYKSLCFTRKKCKTKLYTDKKLNANIIINKNDEE